jgi:hypothetical protein
MLNVKAAVGRRACFFLGAIACASGALSTSAALAAPNCTDFFFNSDGSWSPTHPILIAGPTSQTQVTPSDKFRPPRHARIGRPHRRRFKRLLSLRENFRWAAKHSQGTVDVEAA